MNKTGKIETVPWAGMKLETRMAVLEFRYKDKEAQAPVVGTVRVRYCPDKSSIPAKGFAKYLGEFANLEDTPEGVVNRMADAIHDQVKPKWVEVKGQFRVTGFVTVTVTAERGGAPPCNE